MRYAVAVGTDQLFIPFYDSKSNIQETHEQSPAAMFLSSSTFLLLTQFIPSEGCTPLKYTPKS